MRWLACVVLLLWTVLSGCGAAPPAAPPAPAPAPTAAPPRVIVVGAGLAGLVAAYELQKRGVATHLLEAGDRLGGRVATAYYPGGLHAEMGMQEIWGDNPLLGIARELGVAVDEGEEPFSSTLIDGVLHPFVQESRKEYFASFLSPDEVRALETWLDRAAVLRRTALQKGLADPAVRELEALSFEEWIQKEALPRPVSELVRLTIECELAHRWDRFSALVGLIELGVFLEGGRKAYHVPAGNHRLIDALAGSIRGPKTLGARVLRVDRREDAGRVRARVSYLKGDRVEVLEAERVVLAVPFVRLHEIGMTPPLSPGKWAAIESLDLGQYVVVHMIVDRSAEKLWLVGGESPFPVLSDGPLGVIYGAEPSEDPKANAVIFGLLVYGPAARKLHMKPHDVAARDLVAELEKLWPGIGHHVRETYLYSHHPAAVPLWPKGRSPIDEQAARLFEPETGVYLAGDYLVNAHSDGAVRSGQRVADRIARDLAAESPAR